MPKTARRAVVLSVAVLSISSLAACGANDAAGGGGDDDAKTIALLLPESQTTRYEKFDKPLFEAKVADLCDDCNVIYYNADQDTSKQQQQVATAISEKADVIVLDPVDGTAATSMVKDAQAADIPVIAYDRFIEGADYYMSFDNETVGKLQAQSLVDAIGPAGGKILMLNGSPTDPNAAQFKKGAHSVLDSAAGITIAAEYDNPDWSPKNAQQFTTDQLANVPASELAGVYAANDGQAGGVVAALTGANLTKLPPITGQDAELAAIQRIIAGQQYMTVYKPIATEAEKAAEVAVNVANGDDVGETTDFEGVPSFIFDPIVVTADKVTDTVIKDKFYTVDEICTADYADACAAAGIK